MPAIRLASFVFALVIATLARGEEPVVRGELGRKLDEAVQRAGGPEFWGTVLVAQAGEVQLVKGYGFADYDKRPNAPDTLFELASVTKPITATAVLRTARATNCSRPTRRAASAPRASATSRRSCNNSPAARPPRS